MLCNIYIYIYISKILRKFSNKINKPLIILEFIDYLYITLRFAMLWKLSNVSLRFRPNIFPYYIHCSSHGRCMLLEVLHSIISTTSELHIHIESKSHSWAISMITSIYLYVIYKLTNIYSLSFDTFEFISLHPSGTE